MVVATANDHRPTASVSIPKISTYSLSYLIAFLATPFSTNENGKFCSIAHSNQLYAQVDFVVTNFER